MKRIYTGIDFGSNCIKIVVAEAIGKSFHVLAHNIVRAKGIKKGLIVDIEEVVGCLKSGIKEIEDSLSVRIDQAIVNVSSNGIIFDVVDGNIDIKNEEGIVTSREVASVFQNAVLGKVKEGYELITIMPITFILDQKIVDVPLSLSGKKLAVRAVISSVPKVNVAPVKEVLKCCDIEAIDVTFGIVGDYFEARSRELDNTVSAVIDVGYDSTEVAVFNKGIMIKCDKIPMGSRYVDKDISYVYNIKRGQASYLKEKFAVSNTRYASGNDILDFANQNGDKLRISQIEISEIVEARLAEILKLAKKQINVLTNREISYIILTGGITELAGFHYNIENIFERGASILNITTMGIRNNMYSSSIGMLKYFDKKIEIRGKTYSMFSDKKIMDITSTKKKFLDMADDVLIKKIFKNF
ncbi:MAG: hypothetical protein HFG48_00745 [Bacilli bacterium]|nr:hypothetical protein [Bacilli bacterium]